MTCLERLFQIMESLVPSTLILVWGGLQLVFQAGNGALANWASKCGENIISQCDSGKLCAKSCYCLLLLFLAIVINIFVLVHISVYECRAVYFLNLPPPAV